jgi:hypothetical protein
LQLCRREGENRDAVRAGHAIDGSDAVLANEANVVLGIILGNFDPASIRSSN